VSKNKSFELVKVSWCFSGSYILKSKMQTVLLAKQAAILSPSLFQQTSKMPPLPLYVLMILPSFKDHICMDLSGDPLAKYSPLGLNATEYTPSLSKPKEISYIQRKQQPTSLNNRRKMLGGGILKTKSIYNT
jgi:hypothetical protein